VDVLEFPWGTPVLPDVVDKKLREQPYKIVGMIHAETSTGVMNPAAEIGALLKGKETLYVVDVVTSLGGVEIKMDEWNVDALYSCTRSVSAVLRTFTHLILGQSGCQAHRA